MKVYYTTILILSLYAQYGCVLTKALVLEMHLEQSYQHIAHSSRPITVEEEVGNGYPIVSEQINLGPRH